METFYSQGDKVIVGSAAMPPLYEGRSGTIRAVIKASGGWIYEIVLDGNETPPVILLLSSTEISGYAPRTRKLPPEFDEYNAFHSPFE